VIPSPVNKLFLVTASCLGALQLIVLACWCVRQWASALSPSVRRAAYYRIGLTAAYGAAGGTLGWTIWQLLQSGIGKG
jgi:hypothetical protein